MPAAKKPTNLSINSDLLAQARAEKLNLSRVLEERLVEIVRERGRAAWLTRNRAALEAYNERIGQEGVFSEGLRKY
ncbi:MAG: acetoacetyl-CoA synthase [Gammaproteobacteria bacterium]|nr:MAG: acetoacetyl-CoA synthase [Gammaproteobacteria bacterium]